MIYLDYVWIISVIVTRFSTQEDLEIYLNLIKYFECDNDTIR